MLAYSQGEAAAKPCTCTSTHARQACKGYHLQSTTPTSNPQLAAAAEREKLQQSLSVTYILSHLQAVTTASKSSRPEEPWWVRRLAAKLLHALQGVDPYSHPIPSDTVARVLEIMPEPLTGGWVLQGGPITCGYSCSPMVLGGRFVGVGGRLKNV